MRRAYQDIGRVIDPAEVLVETGAYLSQKILSQKISERTMTRRRPRLEINRAHYPKASGTYQMSEHALRRMYGRSLCLEAVCRALRFGRVTFARGAAHFVLGKKEVKRYEPVRPGDNGLQLVASSIEEGTVLTLYRNRETLPRA